MGGSADFFSGLADRCKEALGEAMASVCSMTSTTTTTLAIEDASDSWRPVMGGKYLIDTSDSGRLGEGAFCVCRRGKIVETGAEVAIRVDKTARSSRRVDDVTLRKFKRCVAVLKKLQEPFVRPADPSLWSSELEYVKPNKLFMRLIDYSQDAHGEPSMDSSDRRLYLVTELAQQSLKDFLAKRKGEGAPVSKETVRSLTKSMLLVMAGLHAKGLVHMDVKPENLMVFDGYLKLIDVDGCMPIGTTISEDDSSVEFSPVYCAPEWASFVVDGPSIVAAPGLDAWSLGCTICELVTVGDALLKPSYVKYVRQSRQSGPAKFMAWLASLKNISLPASINHFDSELAQFVTENLLVCSKTARKSCAQALDTPYLAQPLIQRTRSSPIRAQAYEDTIDI